SLTDDEGIEAESVFVNATVLEREGRGFAVCDHNDLPHVFLLAEQDAPGHAEAFARVGVIRSDLDASELAEGNFLRGIMKEDEGESVAGVLRANEVGERHGDALGRSEAILAVENHAVAAIEKDDRGARAVILALMDHKIGIIHLDRNFGSFAADGVEE